MDEHHEAPAFGADRLLLFGTGSIAVAFLPWWLSWLRQAYPALELRIVVTASAERFVSRHALSALAGTTVALDTWPSEPAPGSIHVEYATWPDAIAVFPATFHCVSRLATGLADTPMMLALQTTRAVVGVAPAVPPGAVDSYAYRQHVAALARRPNTTVASPVEGRSVHTGEQDVGTAVPLPVLLAQIELLRRTGSTRRRVATGDPATGERRAVAWRP